MEWFERTTVAATPQQKHKQQQVQRKLNSSATEKTGNTNETQQRTPDKSSHKEKPESVVATPSKKTSPPVSPTDTQPPKKGSKTLPPKSLPVEERSKVSHINKGKSEKVKHSSQPVSPDKKSPTKTTPAAMVTPEKGKTPTKVTTPPADQQQKTPQDDKTKKTPTSVASTSTSNTPVKPESQQPASEGTHVVSESKGTDKSQQPSVPSPDVDDDFVIVERPPPEDVTDTVAPVEVPVSEYFPVAHVTVNSTDWSLTVVNVGLCLMIYSFHPSRPVTAIKVCTHT